MIDIEFIRNNPEKFKEICLQKGIDLDIEGILKLDKKRRELIRQTESLRYEQKKVQKQDIDSARKIKEEFRSLRQELKTVEEELQNLLLRTPNVFSEDTPLGGEENNKEVFRWGEIPKFDFPAKSHIELGRELDLIDLEKGVKVSGFRGYYLKNEAVMMHMALIWYALEKLVKKGFAPMLTPVIVKEFALVGSGHFPFGKEDIYQIANPGKLADGTNIKTPLYLAGTSEPSLLAYFSDTTLKEEDLPVKVCGVSPCFRSEVGSYGRDTRGLYRLHEFWKVEQVVLCRNDINESNQWLEELRKNAEEILRDLEIPYRVIQIASGDMGAGKYKMYDIEAWMPSRESYGETHSDSNLTDWQARRLGIKYRTREGKKFFVHTLNNTELASPRILIAVLENYQTKKGTIKVPSVLQKYLPFDEIPSGLWRRSSK